MVVDVLNSDGWKITKTQEPNYVRDFDVIVDFLDFPFHPGFQRYSSGMAMTFLILFASFWIIVASHDHSTLKELSGAEP